MLQVLWHCAVGGGHLVGLCIAWSGEAAKPAWSSACICEASLI